MERQGVEGASGVEAASVTGHARKEETRFKRPAFLEVRRCDEGGSPLLAAAVLRLQRVQREEEDREAELHARESDESQVGEASERLAVEQLGILHAGGESPGADRRLRKEGNSEDPGFTNQNLGHPPSSYSCSGPPVRVGKVLVQIDV